ncbi:C40 family peptidase [Nocardia pneumoniae]|uniref:C40 family peptidase n=1 Tax=Nocardia pneumoniae TaxID=228601 RepID=UPI0002F57E6E|nr:C40 family peptidase [Nocardia pneumoniae]
MASSTDVRYFRYLRRVLFWAFAAGAAALMGMLLQAGPASAQELTIPGMGTFEVSDEISLPGALEEPLRNNAILPVAEAPILAEVSEENPILAAISEIEFRTSIPVPQIEIAPFTPAPIIELPISVSVPAVEVPVLAVVPPIEIPFFNVLPSIELPFGAETPGIMPRAPTPPAAAAPRKTPGEIAVEAARTKLGADYNYGAVGPDSFDCSGLVQWSYGQAGVDLPRTSQEQLATGTPVPLDDLRPGDMVSFYDGSHSALYVGEGRVIHASTYGIGVTTSPLSSMPVAGARRF